MRPALPAGMVTTGAASALPEGRSMDPALLRSKTEKELSRRRAVRGTSFLLPLGSDRFVSLCRRQRRAVRPEHQGCRSVGFALRCVRADARGPYQVCLPSSQPDTYGEVPSVPEARNRVTAK